MMGLGISHLRRVGNFFLTLTVTGPAHHESGRREKELIIKPEILFGELEPVLEEELGAIEAAA